MAKPKPTTAAPQPTRPMPPAFMGEMADGVWHGFAPAPELKTWMEDTFIADTGRLHNPEHRHLMTADFEVLWAAGSYVKQGRTVLGTAEMVAFRSGGWQKQRQEQQFLNWFGHIPGFLITVDASFCREASEGDFCALLEHEMYHLGHKRDEFGQLEFDREGNPKIGIRGHDVEEFVGVVRRYGIGSNDSALRELVAASNAAPTVSRLHLSQACGTCLLKVA